MFELSPDNRQNKNPIRRALNKIRKTGAGISAEAVSLDVVPDAESPQVREAATNVLYNAANVYRMVHPARRHRDQFGITHGSMDLGKSTEDNSRHRVTVSVLETVDERGKTVFNVNRVSYSQVSEGREYLGFAVDFHPEADHPGIPYPSLDVLGDLQLLEQVTGRMIDDEEKRVRPV